MITIIADPHAYQAEPPDALHAKGLGDYVKARSAIRRALNNGQRLTVLVTNQLVLRWLHDLTEYHGIEWEEVAPEADYRRLFGAEPPPLFSPNLLIAVDIKTVTAPPTGRPVDPVGWVLGERLDPIWAVQHGSTAHIARLLDWIFNHAVESYFYPLVQQRLDAWASDEHAYTALRAGSLASDAINLVRRAALQRYDDAWLREQGLADVPLVALTLEHTHWVAALKAVEPAITRYWQAQIAQSPLNSESFRVIIERVSGRSSAELHAIEHILQHNADLLDTRAIQALRRCFADLPEAIAIIDELETFVPPLQPALPEPVWPDEQWFAWATNEYMPYFAWVIRARQPREHQQACALAYETWLAHRYPDWLGNSESPLITRQFTLLRDLLAAQPNALVVWLVVDGLTWWQGRMMQEICRHLGLHPQRYETGVALLPSVTDISKRALVTGLPVSELPRNTIAHAASEKLSRAGLHGYAGYDAPQATDALRSDPNLQYVIYFANMLDGLAHDRPDFPDGAVVRAHLEELGRHVAQMRAISTQQGRHFHVLVGSDHGSTLLPSNAPTLRLPQAAREVTDVWEGIGEQPPTRSGSARAAFVKEAQQHHIEQLEDWHYLDRLQYYLPQDYLVPRGYAAIGRRPSGWTHGGLSPEETIVPLMHFAPEPMVAQELIVTISGRIRAQHAGSLAITLANPNPAPLDAIMLQIADLSPVNIQQVAANGRYETVISVPARPIKGTDLPLFWQIECTILGVDYRQQGEANIAVQRFQTETNLDDLF